MLLCAHVSAAWQLITNVESAHTWQCTPFSISRDAGWPDPCSDLSSDPSSDPSSNPSSDPGSDLSSDGCVLQGQGAISAGLAGPVEDRNWGNA